MYNSFMYNKAGNNTIKSGRKKWICKLCKWCEMKAGKKSTQDQTKVKHKIWGEWWHWDKHKIPDILVARWLWQRSISSIFRFRREMDCCRWAQNIKCERLSVGLFHWNQPIDGVQQLPSLDGAVFKIFQTTQMALVRSPLRWRRISKANGADTTNKNSSSRWCQISFFFFGWGEILSEFDGSLARGWTGVEEWEIQGKRWGQRKPKMSQ